MPDTSVPANTLLAVPEATIRTSTPTTGTLYLEYLSVTSPPGSTNHSVYLVIRLNDVEFPVDPSRPIARHITPDGTHVYIFNLDEPAAQSLGFKGDSVPISLSLRGSPDPARKDVIETFDQILGQYAVLEGMNGDMQQSTGRNLQEGAGIPADLRGRLVLMDETTGEMVGEVPHRLPIHEDPALEGIDKTEGAKDVAHAAPVVLELPSDLYDEYTGQQRSGAETVAAVELSEAREIFVRAVPPEQQDWMMKSASLISRGIDSSTSLLARGISSASQYYIKHSTPYSPTTPDGKPVPASRAVTVLTHPTTHTALGYAHTASGHAARVSAKTVELVQGMIRHAMSGRPTAAASTPLPAPASVVSSTSAVNVDPVVPYSTYPFPSSEKPPLPPRRDGSKSPAPPLPPRSLNKSPASLPAPQSLPSNAAESPPLRTRDRLALSANLVLAAIDESTTRLLDVGTAQLGVVVGHRYGPAAARSTTLAAGTARNVVLVYVDVRGFARRAIIKRVGKEFVKGRVASTKGRVP